MVIKFDGSLREYSNDGWLFQMKILLVYPPRVKSATWLWAPLGLSYIGSVLKNESHKVRGLDLRCQSYDLYINAIKSWKPDWIGFYIETVSFEESKALMLQAKMNSSKVMVGGPHPSVCPEEVISLPYIDVVVVGEGEETVKELVSDKPWDEINGIYYKKEGKIKENLPRPPIKNLDALPFPDRELFPIKTYLEYSWFNFPLPAPNLHLVASRGCPYDCRFCAPTMEKMFGHGIRYRSVGNVIAEIKYLINRYRIKGFRLTDEVPLINRKWIAQFCREIIKEGLHDVPWMCASRVDTIDHERVNILQKAGCIGIGFGIESGSQRVLDYYQKRITPEQSRLAVKICKEHGIIVYTSLMVGAPYETINDLEETRKLLKDVDPEMMHASVTTPYPGTHLYKECARDKLLTVQSSRDYDRILAVPKMKTITPMKNIERYRNSMTRILPSLRFFLTESYYRRATMRWFLSIAQTRRLHTFLCQSLHLLRTYKRVRRYKMSQITHPIEEANPQI